MQLAQNGFVIHQLQVLVPFLQDQTDIIFFYGMVGGDLLVTTAIGAKRFAIRQMNVQADALTPVFDAELLTE